MKIRQHRPSYFTGFENSEMEFNTRQELLEIPWVKRFSEPSDFYGYFVSMSKSETTTATLMALYDWNDEYFGCTRWYVIGFLTETDVLPNTTHLGLKEYTDYIYRHKPNCWSRKYDSLKDDFFTYDHSRISEKKQLEIAKSLGWKRDDFFGIANTCDCGYKELKK
jgi:hypothetical protein